MQADHGLQRGCAQEPGQQRLPASTADLGDAERSGRAQEAIHPNLHSVFQQAVWGGIAYEAEQTNFAVTPYPIPGNPRRYGVANAPYGYWRRNLDSYTRIMGIVDQRVGDVLNEFLNLPSEALPGQIIPTELRAPLPPPLKGPRAITRKAYLLYDHLPKNYTPSEEAETPLPSLIGFGKEF